MTGHERDTVKGMSIAMLANVVMNFILIPQYGMVGAATATAISYAIWNVILWQFVWKRHSIETMAFCLSNIRILGSEECSTPHHPNQARSL